MSDACDEGVIGGSSRRMLRRRGIGFNQEYGDPNLDHDDCTWCGYYEDRRSMEFEMIQRLP